MDRETCFGVDTCGDVYGGELSGRIFERMEVDEVAVPATVEALLVSTVQHQERPRPVPVLEPTYEVERLLDRRVVPGNRLEYLVQWKGYSDPSWVPAGNVQGRQVSGS